MQQQQQQQDASVAVAAIASNTKNDGETLYLSSILRSWRPAILIT
jgi:hypothetical protein